MAAMAARCSRLLTFTYTSGREGEIGTDRYILCRNIEEKIMVNKVRRWGNSLAVRIPKPLAEDLGLDVDSQVDVSVVEGTLRLVPIHPKNRKLDDLLAAVTEENLHDAADWGGPVGKEVW